MAFTYFLTSEAISTKPVLSVYSTLFLEILALLYVTSAFVTLVFAVCKLSLNVASEATLKSVSFGV